jgi:hypothetical protein
MKKIWLPVVFLILLISAGFAAGKPKFIASTSLCGVKLQDRFTEVVKKYGRDSIQAEYGDENPSESIIYNDPKIPAHLAVGCGSYPFPGIEKATVTTITLKKGYYNGKKGHFASRSFAEQGTIKNAKLGDTKQDLKKKNNKIRFWKNANLEVGSVDLGSTKDAFCSISFILEKGKVTEIISRFSQ